MLDEKGQKVLSWALLLLFVFIFIFSLTKHARADDPGLHNSPGHDWYQNAITTEWSRDRLAGMMSCCHHSDVVRTQFRSSKAKDAEGKWHDEWWYLHPATNQWRQIPNDIIHDASDNAPDGKPTLFIWSGQEVCFFLPRQEGG